MLTLVMILSKMPPPEAVDVKVAGCVQQAQLICYCHLIVENSKPEDNFELNYICVFNQEANIIDYVITVLSVYFNPWENNHFPTTLTPPLIWRFTAVPESNNTRPWRAAIKCIKYQNRQFFWLLSPEIQRLDGITLNVCGERPSFPPLSRPPALWVIRGSAAPALDSITCWGTEELGWVMQTPPHMALRRRHMLLVNGGILV